MVEHKFCDRRATILYLLIAIIEILSSQPTLSSSLARSGSSQARWMPYKMAAIQWA